ncbi:MAG: histidine phosphatase family protein [Rhodospirillales bacterium]|nr:histidine phosphatase family protein [Rhodospirillales bacterium]
MRHAIAPGTGDPVNFALGDCKTQRNLDKTGQNQARETGNQIREREISIDTILSSQWCRCLETATLLELGTVSEEPALNSFFRDRSTADQQTDQLIARLNTLPKNSKALLITHQVNITKLTGIYPRSGEIILIRVDGNGNVKTLGRFMPKEQERSN